MIVAPVPRLPLASVRLLVDAGASAEQRDHAGVASLTARALAEGTARLDGAALAEEFELLGGSLSVSATWDAAHIWTTVTRDHLGKVLPLLGEVLLTPAFPEREVNRLREERIAELLELRAEPRGLADLIFEACIYTSASRFALPETGSNDTVRSLTRERVREFYDARFRPAGTTVIVVGDVSVEEVLRQTSKSFASWRGEFAPVPPVNALPATEQRTIHFISRPGAPQTELRVGHVGVPRRHPDYFGLVVMNALFGGVFNSRINLNLRERHGYTYGASSFFEWRRDAGPFTVSTAVATGVTAAAITEIIRELNGVRQAPPNADELSLAVSYLEGVFPIRFETTEAIGSALASLKAFGLPDEYYGTYRAHIRAVTAADVERVARTHVRTDQLQIVAVGDAQLRPELEALGIGLVVDRDEEGSL